jgi:hypothetical protein
MRLVRLMTVFCAIAAASFSLASSSDATPIGPTCGTCQGSIYELSYSGSPITTTATSETFQITYTIDTSGYTGTGVFLDTVALKVASSFLDALLVSAPGGVAGWTEMFGGLNAAGCSGSGSGYDCVRIAALVNAPVVPGATYTWVFNIEVPTGTLFVDTDEASVKARYVNASGLKVGNLVSENITLSSTGSPPNVPEPRLGLLLLAALPSLALWRRVLQH